MLNHTPSNAASPQSRSARVHIGPNHYFEGRVVDGLFHVDDVANGTSFQALTHSRPNFKPIPLETIERNGDTLEFLDLGNE